MTISLPTPLGYETFASGTATLAFTGITVAAGDAIFLYYASAVTPPVFTVSDTSGNTYILAGDWGQTDAYYGALFYATDVVALTNGTVTVTFSPATNYSGVVMIAASAATSFIAPDYVGTGISFNGTTPTMTSGALTYPDELVLGFEQSYPFGNSETPSGWTSATYSPGNYAAMDAIATSSTSPVTYAPPMDNYRSYDVATLNIISFFEPLAPTVGALTFIGYAPTLVTETDVYPGVGALTFTGYAPTMVPTPPLTGKTWATSRIF